MRIWKVRSCLGWACHTGNSLNPVYTLQGWATSGVQSEFTGAWGSPEWAEQRYCPLPHLFTFLAKVPLSKGFCPPRRWKTTELADLGDPFQGSHFPMIHTLSTTQRWPKVRTHSTCDFSYFVIFPTITSAFSVLCLPHPATTPMLFKA